MRCLWVVALAGCSFQGRSMVDDASVAGDGTVGTDGTDVDAPEVDVLGPPGGVAATVLAWYAADDAVRDVDNAVTAWPDRGPQHRDLVPEGDPHWRTLRAGIGAVKFSSDRFVGPSVFGTASYDQLAAFAVVRDDTHDTFDWIVYEGTNTVDRFSISHAFMGALTYYFDAPTTARLMHNPLDGAVELYSYIANANAAVLGTAYQYVLAENGTQSAAGNDFLPYAGTGQPFELGDHIAADNSDGSHNPYDGYLGELYLLATSPTLAEAMRIETYLAIRHGITLHHPYYASSGSVVRDVATGYDTHIVALAHDRAGGLDTTSAISATDGELLAVRGTSTTPASYVFLGDDGGQVMFVPTTASADSKILHRKWRIDTVGWSEPLQIDVAATGANTDAMLPTAASDVVVLLLADNPQMTGATMVNLTKTNSRWVGAATTSGVQYATFAIK